MNQSDISATGLFGHTLSDLKLAFVVMSYSFIIANWSEGLGALFDALL